MSSSMGRMTSHILWKIKNVLETTSQIKHGVGWFWELTCQERFNWSFTPANFQCQTTKGETKGDFVSYFPNSYTHCNLILKHGIPRWNNRSGFRVDILMLDIVQTSFSKPSKTKKRNHLDMYVYVYIHTYIYIYSFDADVWIDCQLVSRCRE